VAAPSLRAQVVAVARQMPVTATRVVSDAGGAQPWTTKTGQSSGTTGITHKLDSK
jgi:hypothetical protein